MVFINYQGNVNQNYKDIPTYTARITIIKKKKKKKDKVLAGMWRNTWSIVSGKQNGATAIENGIKIPQKLQLNDYMIQQCLLNSVYVCTYI